jgi:hypothetical protein
LAPTSIVLHPNWDYNDFGNGYDLAVLNFASGLPGINFYPIYTYPFGESELSDSFELFGYGRCGTPQFGISGGGTCAVDGLHRAANRVDSLRTNGRILEYSFDSYSTNLVPVGNAVCRENDALCFAEGLETTSKELVPEIGTRQGVAVPGDSGGPSLILVAGQYFSIGLHSYLSCISSGTNCLQPPDFDGSARPNGSWGEIAGDTRLTVFGQFIADVAEVPEPSTWLLAGLGIFAMLRRGRMLHSSKADPPRS